MAGINIHSASPLSASSSQESIPLLDKSETSEAAKGESMDITDAQTSMTEDKSSVDTDPKPASTPTKSMPKLNTRIASTSYQLPWRVDETSSPHSSTSARKPSFVPPPPRSKASRTASESAPQLSTLQISTSSSPSNYSSQAPSSPYTLSSLSFDLSSPPGYTQNARASFSDRPLYENSTPFYQNSYSSGFSSPMTPSRRGKGILDNDPDIYLRGEGDGEEETVWDTAAKWAKAAGKRMSQTEQQIWKMVEAVTSAETDR